MGLQLGMSPEHLDVIEGEHKRKDDCCTAMFKEWLRGAPGTGNKKRSWESVLCAVETGHGTTAEEEIRKGLREIAAQPDSQAAALSDKVKLSRFCSSAAICENFHPVENLDQVEQRSLSDYVTKLPNDGDSR